MASDSSVRVEVRGIAELSAAFKGIDKELPKALQVEFKAIAEGVARKAAGKVPQGKTGHAAGSIRARATAKGAGIAFGGPKAEYYPWLDFGGRVGRKRSIKRDIVSGGRYVYPTIGENKEEIGRAALEAIERVAERNDFEVRG